MAQAAPTVKRVALELGGKNPNIVFADADREAALDNAPHGRLPPFRRSAPPVRACSSRSPSRTTSSTTSWSGPAAYGRAVRILGHRIPHQRSASRQSRGRMSHADSPRGPPTLVAAPARRSGTRWRAFYLPDGPRPVPRRYGHRPGGVLGPVLTVETFTTDDEAIPARQQHDLWPRRRRLDQRSRPRRSRRCAPAPGTVWDQRLPPYVAPAEWGGYKQSGIGRELGDPARGIPGDQAHLAQHRARAPSGWFA